MGCEGKGAEFARHEARADIADGHQPSQHLAKNQGSKIPHQ